MKRFFSFISLLAWICTSWAQQGSGNLTFSKPTSSDDSSLGANRASVIFITPYEGFTIVAVDKRDMVMKSVALNDGTFTTQVMCDLTDRAADPNHSFRVNIAGTALGDYIKVALTAGKRFTIQVQQALQHDLYFNYPNTQRAWTDATKSAIEFSVPDYIKNPKVEFTSGIGQLLKPATASGMNIITLEIDCEKLKQLQTEIPAKQAAAEAKLKQLQADLAAHEKYFDEHNTDANFDFDADERRKTELEDAIEHVYDDVPELSVVLYADKSNVVRVDRSRLANLTEPRQRLQINVGDGMHKETIYKEATFDELLSNARDYFKNYRQHYEYKYFDAANVAYDQAIAHDDCPFELRDQLRLEKDTIAFLRKYTLYREKADTLARKAEAEKGFSSEDTYKALVGEHRFLDMLIKAHPDMSRFQEMDATIQARIQQHPSAKKTVTEQVVKQRQHVKGRVIIDNQYLTIRLNSISIYAAPYSTIKKDDRSRLKLLGRADAEGNFDVIMPEDMDYIITSAELQRKSEAHLVTGTTMDIHIK